MADEKIAEQTEAVEAAGRSCPQCALPVPRTLDACPACGTKLSRQLRPGDIVVGNYEFVRVIGAGGMGTVYECKQPLLNKQFAIKVLHSHLSTEHASRRFQQEGRAAAKLQHANLISVHDLGLTADGQPYMIMDFVSGTTLAEILQDKGPLPVADALDVFVQICHGLDYAHSHGVWHRDLKPANIMLTQRDGEQKYLVHIVDFGIAKVQDLAQDQGGSLTATGDIMGSPLYMSPEQAQSQKTDARSDIYSLGCLMFEALTGFPPLSGATTFATLMMHLNDAPPSLKEVTMGGTFSPALEAIVQKTLAKRPEDRYQSAAELERDLVGCISGGVVNRPVIQSAGKQGAPDAVPPWQKIVIPALVGLLLAVAAVGFFISFGTLTPTLETKKVSAPFDGRVPLPEDGYGNIQNNRLMQIVDRNFDSDTIQDLHELKLTDEGLIYLGKMPNLRNLDLQGCILREGIGPLDRLKLWRLNLNDVVLKDPHVEPIGRISTLTCLKLSNNTCLTDEALTYLTSLHNLKELGFANNDIDDLGVKTLTRIPSLEVLNLDDDPRIDDNAVPDLLKLSKLRRLSMKGVTFSPGSMEMLKALPLEELSLKGHSLKDVSCAAIATFPRLTKLTMQKCDIGDQGVEILSHMPGLRELNLSGCKPITLKGLSTLARLPKLTYLIIQDCPKLTDSDISKLRQAMPHCTIVSGTEKAEPQRL